MTNAESNSSGNAAHTWPADSAAPAPGPQPSWLREFLRFLRDNKAWWLTPLLLAVGLVLLLAWLSREPHRPPTYPHF